MLERYLEKKKSKKVKGNGNCFNLEISKLAKSTIIANISTYYFDKDFYKNC